MNTFALILFGFVLYLAVNGKLTDYTALVTSQSSTNDAASSGSAAAQPSQVPQ